MSNNTGTVRRSFPRRVSRLLLTLVVALGMTVFASMTQQAGATSLPAANVSIYHECEGIGTLSNGNEADVCNDLTSVKVSGGTEFWGTGEYYCQGPSQQCKGIHADNNLESSVSGTLTNNPYDCTTSDCPNGGRAMASTPHVFLPTGQCTQFTTNISAGAAILVNGTSTAFHPRGPIGMGAKGCG